MIICQNVSSGTFDFVWDGGNSIVSFQADNWNGSTASFSIAWIDEFGVSHGLVSSGSNGTQMLVLPAGQYVLSMSNSPINLNVAIRKVPA